MIDPDTYSLSIGGPYVNNPLTLSYDDLLNFEHVSRPVCLVCISNPIGGELVKNVVYTGVPLSVLLDEAGFDDPTDPTRQIYSTAADGYTGGFRAPLAYDGRAAMVALFANGEPLAVEHGFPARLVVAGEFAQTSATKWLESIEVNDFFEVDSFWVPRGWAKEAPVKTSSRIDTPLDRTPLTSSTTTIAGVAWAPEHGIERVEVGISDGSVGLESVRWADADVGSVESDETWVQWIYEWEANTPGDWFIQVRATDKSGFTQSPVVVSPAPDGAEGYDTTMVTVI